MTSFWCLYCYLSTYFTAFFRVSNVELEKVNVCWEDYPQVDLLAFHREIKYSYLQRVIEITINLLTAPKKFFISETAYW